MEGAQPRIANFVGSFDPEEKWNGWGPDNKYFFLNNAGDATLSTSRAVFPKFMPFLRDAIAGVQVTKVPAVKIEDVALPPSVLNQAFMDEIKKFLKPDQIAVDHQRRIRHTYGRSLRDLLRLRRGIISRAPDVVLYPQSHEDVEKVVALASKHLVDIVPYGGGTNIVGATEPTPVEKDRSICSLDMRRMNRVLSIDKAAHTAVIEAGALGPDLEEQLHREGYSLGHDPDSFEYSTLGGWLATCSSGMQSDKYGDIEDLCVSLTIVAPTGTIVTPPVPRNGSGPNLKHLFVGTEGTLGIITRATMKVHRLPPSRVFEGFLFPSFETGAAAIQDLVEKLSASYVKQDTQEALPSMVRLYDPDETRLSFAMKPTASPFAQFVSNSIKKYLEYVKSYDINTICLMITGTEGEPDDVRFKRNRLYKVLKAGKGFPLGTAPGQAWHAKRYDLPLMRDFILEIGLWVDVCESAAPFPHVIPLWKNVKQAIHNAFAKHNAPGWAGCHISHTYKNGVCLYFHFASLAEQDFAVYLAAKAGATEAILRNKGALSHHHGVGFEHLPWVRKYFDAASLRTLRALKASLDPNSVCNPGKLIPSEAQERSDAPEKSFGFWTLSPDLPRAKL